MFSSVPPSSAATTEVVERTLQVAERGLQRAAAVMSDSVVVERTQGDGGDQVP